MLILILIAGLIITIAAIMEIRNKRHIRQKKLAEIERRKKELAKRERAEQEMARTESDKT